MRSLSVFCGHNERSQFTPPDLPSFADLCRDGEADDSLFDSSLSNSHHVLRHLFPVPSQASQHYLLRPRRRCTDTLNPWHFGPKTLRTFQTSDLGHSGMSEVSRHFGTGAEKKVSKEELSRDQTSTVIVFNHIRSNSSLILRCKTIFREVVPKCPGSEVSVHPRRQPATFNRLHLTHWQKLPTHTDNTLDTK